MRQASLTRCAPRQVPKATARLPRKLDRSGRARSCEACRQGSHTRAGCTRGRAEVRTWRWRAQRLRCRTRCSESPKECTPRLQISPSCVFNYDLVQTPAKWHAFLPPAPSPPAGGRRTKIQPTCGTEQRCHATAVPNPPAEHCDTKFALSHVAPYAHNPMAQHNCTNTTMLQDNRTGKPHVSSMNILNGCSAQKNSYVGTGLSYRAPNTRPRESGMPLRRARARVDTAYHETSPRGRPHDAHHGVQLGREARA